jgi:hypothetical protein
VPGRAQAVGRERVADLAQLILRRAAAPVDDLGAEVLDAEACIGLGFVPAQAVVHVQRRRAVAELAQHVPEAGRVGAARDEADQVASLRDQVVTPNEPLDAFLDVHANRVDASRSEPPM